MWAQIVNILSTVVGPLVSLFNKIINLFTKTPIERSTDRVSDRMEEIDEQIDDARNSKPN